MSTEKTAGDHRLLTAGKWAGAIAGIIGLVVTIWGGISRISDLVESVEENSAAVEALQAENTRIASESRESITRVVEAVQARAERDQEIITQLRIAVAALEAASGRDVGAVRRPVGTPPPSPITVDPAGHVRIPDRSTASDLRLGARGALDRAGTIAAVEDPLSRLDGL